MKHTRSFLTFGALLLLATGRAQAATPSHITARIVSVDPPQRTMVIVDSEGARQTVELDDQVGGFGDVKSGDRVLLTMQYDPGHPRVLAIVKSGATVAHGPGATGSVVTAAPRTAAAPATVTAQNASAQAAFASRATVLAEEASRVDLTWNAFRDSCEAKTSADYSGGREWFSLWDRSATSDLSNGFCRDLFNQIVGRGGDVVRGMAAAEESALVAGLLPGTLRDIRRSHGLDWDGWSKPAPDRQATP